MTYAADTNYVLSYQSAEELDNGVKEFETYSEAFEAYKQYQMSGYGVVIHDLERTPCLYA
jgi:hypothetical protein